MGIHYLYDGDINFSTDEIYIEVKTSPLTSPSFMINCIVKIYEQSIDILKKRSKTIVIPEEIVKFPSGNWQSLDTNKLINFINSELGCYPAYVFTSAKSFHKVGFDSKLQLDKSRPFPGYFYTLTKLTGLHTDVIFSPFVEDEEGELILYASDKSFQSLVYSIQNMDYEVEMVNEDDIKNYTPYHEIKWKHTIRYKLYDCKFNSLKVIIKNVSKIRDEKINQILDGN